MRWLVVAFQADGAVHRGAQFGSVLENGIPGGGLQRIHGGEGCFGLVEERMDFSLELFRLFKLLLRKMIAFLEELDVAVAEGIDGRDELFEGLLVNWRCGDFEV